MTKIIIDERETFLFHAIPKEANASKEVLPLGDIIITSDSGSPIVLFERKTLSDLLSSIKDGRYEEQSYRLQHASMLSPHNIVYIIEGMYSQLSKPTDKKVVLSAMTSLMCFKGFHVLRTSSIQDTADLIVYMADKIHRSLLQGKLMYTSNRGEVEETIEPYSTVVKKVKKENLTPENMGEVILCQIPGIRSVTAVAIMKHVQGSILNLIKLLQDPILVQTLETIVVGERKISKTVVANLKRFFLYTVDETINP
jgi:ERCC4-type nuclease